ncbi:exported hypothetical protein [Candidatus Sulfopaludibacter sp. SbA3]|nr:exported hypothetical protein [Candidatus Sulfopaludibacter sp. SbA3]
MRRLSRKRPVTPAVSAAGIASEASHKTPPPGTIFIPVGEASPHEPTVTVLPLYEICFLLPPNWVPPVKCSAVKLSRLATASPFLIFSFAHAVQIYGREATS